MWPKNFTIFSAGVISPLAHPRNLAESLNAVAAAFDAELLDPAAQGAGIELDDGGGAIGPVDTPIGLLENRDNVLLLDTGQRAFPEIGIAVARRVILRLMKEARRRRGADRRNQFRSQFQLGARGENNGALDDVFQFTDITGPAVGGQPLHRRGWHAID